MFSLKNNTQNVVEKLISNPFLNKTSKLSMSLDQHSEILYSLYLLSVQVGHLPIYIETKVLTTVLTSYKDI